MIYGVCLHPKYVGWFALRAVIIFEDNLVPELVYKPPKEILNVRFLVHRLKAVKNSINNVIRNNVLNFFLLFKDDAKKIELLNRYNFNWQDWVFNKIKILI